MPAEKLMVQPADDQSCSFLRFLKLLVATGADFKRRVCPVPEKPDPVGAVRFVAGKTGELYPVAIHDLYPPAGKGMSDLCHTAHCMGLLGNLRVTLQTQVVDP